MRENNSELAWCGELASSDFLGNFPRFCGTLFERDNFYLVLIGWLPTWENRRRRRWRRGRQLPSQPEQNQLGLLSTQRVQYIRVHKKESEYINLERKRNWDYLCKHYETRDETLTEGRKGEGLKDTRTNQERTEWYRRRRQRMEDKKKQWRKPSFKPWTIFAQPECDAQNWWPVDENENVMADHYNLIWKYLLSAYMADWILLT